MFLLSGKQRIFVSVAAYRDSETPKTVRNLLANADRPQNVHVGVLSQLNLPEDNDCRVGTWTNVHETIMDYRESLGACWARSFVFTKLLREEDFVLQIDSHSRFIKGWDTHLLQMFENLQDPRAVLTHYPDRYDPLTGELGDPSYTRFDIQSFGAYGLPTISSASLSLSDAPKKPVLTAFVAGGCLFTRAKTIKEVPYDPYLYFNGEEVSYAIRLWTHGYNLYLPNRPFMWHDYGNNRGRRLHWEDVPGWENYNKLSIARVRHLLDLQIVQNPEAIKELNKYGLGRNRTLNAWERFAGLNLRSGTVLEKAKTGAFQ